MEKEDNGKTETRHPCRVSGGVAWLEGSKNTYACDYKWVYRSSSHIGRHYNLDHFSILVGLLLFIKMNHCILRFKISHEHNIKTLVTYK